MFCARCGQQLTDNSEICSYCGQPANWNWQTPPPPAPGQPSAAAPVRQFAPPSGSAYGLEGVRGALLFFCIAMTILWPLWVLSQFTLYRFRLTAFGVLALLRLLFGIIVGALLWSRQAGALVLLRVYLIFGGVLTVFNLFNVFQFSLRYGSRVLFSVPVMLSTGSSLCLLGSLILYFSLSERVRATYGSKLFG